MLNDIEKQIINNVFDMQINHGPKIELKNYDLIEKDNPDYKAKWSEFGSYILKLRSIGYLKFDDNIITHGGQQNQKYRNNIINVWTESLDIDKDGIAYIVKERESLKDKTIKGLKNSGKSLFRRVSEVLIGVLIGLIIAWLTKKLNLS